MIVTMNISTETIMNFFQKEIYVKRKKKEDYFHEKRGKCFGVFVSKKTGEIKYLFCSLDNDQELCVPASAIEFLDEDLGGIYLKNLRAAVPKQCAKLTPFLPVYSLEGRYLGRLDDVFAENLTATKLLVGKQKYPVLFIDAATDALLLKSQPYPVGEWSETEESNVSKKLLKDKIRDGALIRFTLSLPPFKLDRLG